MNRVINARITTSGTIHMKAALARYTALPLMMLVLHQIQLPSAAEPIAKELRSRLRRYQGSNTTVDTKGCTFFGFREEVANVRHGGREVAAR